MPEKARRSGLRVPELIYRFTDRVQGDYQQHLGREVGDFVIQRRDGLYAYQLAVVLDDAWQGVTDIVRGADLLDNTPRQLYLQELLGFSQPRYLHIPLIVQPDGHKLGKSYRSPPCRRSMLHRCCCGHCGHWGRKQTPICCWQRRLKCWR